MRPGIPLPNPPRKGEGWGGGLQIAQRTLLQRPLNLLHNKPNYDGI